MTSYILSLVVGLVFLTQTADGCPGGVNETYCSDVGGCITNGENCTQNATIVSCVNQTTLCVQNATIFCANANHTCVNTSLLSDNVTDSNITDSNQSNVTLRNGTDCGDSLWFCAATNRCIGYNETCCSTKDIGKKESCDNVLKYSSFFQKDGDLDAICGLFLTRSNFSSNYSEIMKNNPITSTKCPNNTYFCPLTLSCIATNLTCDPAQTNNDNDIFEYFNVLCENDYNQTFCPLLMSCIPNNELCSYEKLFDWSNQRNTTAVGPFGRNCSVNESFCLLTFDCEANCDSIQVSTNKTCDNEPGSFLCPETLECVNTTSQCNTSKYDYTNVTDSTVSGWLDICINRHVVMETFWQRLLDCQHTGDQCQKHQPSCNFSHDEFCEHLNSYNNTAWLENQLNNTNATVNIMLGDCSTPVNNTDLISCKNDTSIKECVILDVCANVTAEFTAPEDVSKIGRTVIYGDCKVTLDTVTFSICAVVIPTVPGPPPCELSSLCAEILLDFTTPEDAAKLNTTRTYSGCNITVNSTVVSVCNITVPEPPSCELNSLCAEIKEDFTTPEDAAKLNTTRTYSGCNITVNSTVVSICNITVPEPPSCELNSLCAEIKEDFTTPEDAAKLNNTRTYSGCNITVNSTVVSICNITVPEPPSCELNSLCAEIKKDFTTPEDAAKLNTTRTYSGCNITVNSTVVSVCNITVPEPPSCELNSLCAEIKKDFTTPEDAAKLNTTRTYSGCNITVNSTVVSICNITVPEPPSCELNSLCAEIKEDFTTPEDAAKLNITRTYSGCNITVNSTVVSICNITVPGPRPRNKSCKVRELCGEIRKEFLAKDDFKKVNETLKITGCNITMSEEVLKECNVSKIRYNMIYDGFKISDSIDGEISYIAITSLDVSRNNGTWKYNNGGSWMDIGAVTTDNALVIETSSYLSFTPRKKCWNGLVTLTYTPVRSGATGSLVNVSHIPQDPRHTLALISYPPTPVANLISIGSAYTVPEDEDTAEIKFQDKISLNLTCADPQYNIPQEELEYLDEDILRDYSETVELYSKAVPTIAMTANNAQGNWKVAQKSASTISTKRPKMVKPRDSLRFVPNKDIYGNFTMHFVPAVFYNVSFGSGSSSFLDAPVNVANALKGAINVKNAKGSKGTLEDVLKEMASSGSSYTLENFNNVVDGISASPGQKNELKDIGDLAFARVSSSPSRSSTLPRILSDAASFIMLNNLNNYTLHVVVTPTNDQPSVTRYLVQFPPIAYNYTDEENVGKRVGDMTSEGDEPLVEDVDGSDVNGIAVVHAANTSVGAWYYRDATTNWTQLLVDNRGFTDAYDGNLQVFLLTPDAYIRFKMHTEETMWSKTEASQLADLVFLAWDMSDGNNTGRQTVQRIADDDNSIFSTRSVLAIALRIGCDHKIGSKGRYDQCDVCGGDDSTCLGCDNVLNSGATIDICGMCTGGNTSKTPNYLYDCADTCGLSFRDECGLCQEKANIQNQTDCSGTCFGAAINNTCGYCAGGTTGKPLTYGQDLCGICFGDNSTCLDCASVPNGGKTVDFCGLCLSTEDPRRDNQCVKLVGNSPAAGPTFGDVLVTLRGAGLKDKTSVICEMINQADNITTAIVSSSFKSVDNARVINFLTPELLVGEYKVSCKFDGLSTTYEVTDTTFIVYNKSLIIHEKLDPEEILIEKAESVQISGSGFLNTSDLACVSHIGVVYKATFINNATVSCALPAFEQSTRLRLAVSMSLADRLVPEGNLTLAVNAPVPAPTSAMFLDSLEGIMISFNRPAEPARKGKVQACSFFFHNSILPKFGSKAKCLFRQPTQMVVILAGKPTIVPNDFISFNLSSFKHKFQKYTSLARGIVATKVASPANPVSPTAIISGSGKIGVCAALKLKAGDSFGGGGRNLLYNWTVEWDDPSDGRITANATTDLNDIKAVLENVNGTYKRNFKFEAPSLLINLAYKFSLQVIDFLGQKSDISSLVVTRENKNIPRLSLGAAQQTMRTALGKVLKARVKLSSCLTGNNKPKVVFSWETDALGYDFGATDLPVLRISPGLLPGGKTYKIRCTATMQEDASLTTTTEIELQVLATPLRAIIKEGTTMTVGASGILKLDGSKSFDPDDAFGTAYHIWSCFTSTGQACLKPDPANPGKKMRLVVPSIETNTIDVASTLESNKEYVFKLLYKKGSRESEASIRVFVQPGTPPDIEIRPLQSLKINPTEKLTLRALIKSKKSVVMTWSCVEESGMGYIDLNEEGVLLTKPSKKLDKNPSKASLSVSFDLAIKKNQLGNDVQYKFRLTAENADSSAYTEIVVITNEAPTLGVLDVTPSSGFFGNTSFTLGATEDWSDSKDDFPLTYQFGYFKEDTDTGDVIEKVLGTPTSENALDGSFLPQGDQSNNYTLTLFVDVTDIYGAKTRQTSEVVVKEAVISVDVAENLFKGVDDAFSAGNFADAAGEANVFAAALAGETNPNVTKALKAFKQNVRDQVLSALEGGAVVDESGKVVVRQSLLEMTKGCKPDCGSVRLAENMAKMEGVGASGNARRKRRSIDSNSEIIVKTTSEVETVLQIFDNIIAPADYSSDSNTTKRKYLSTVKVQQQSLCLSLASGEPALITKSNLTVMKTEKPINDATLATNNTNFIEVSSSNLPNYINAPVFYKFGSEILTYYSSWSCSDGICSGVCIGSAQFDDDLLISHNPSDKNLTRLSDVVSIHLFDPINSEEVTGNTPLYSSAVTLRFPISNGQLYENYTKECRLWDKASNDWISSGCSYVQTINSSIVECVCNQFGYFTVFKGVEIVPTTLPTTTEPPQNTTTTSNTVENEIKMKFIFQAKYDDVISGNTTKQVFLSELRHFLADLLNISVWRVSDLDISGGNITVTMSILPSNTSYEASSNSSAALLKNLVENNAVNFTVPNNGTIIRVDPTSFEYVYSTTTTVAPTKDGDDDGLSTTEIVMIAVFCSLIFLFFIIALLYYCLKVRPRQGASKVTPHNSRMALQQQNAHEEDGKKQQEVEGINNNAAEYEEKAV